MSFTRSASAAAMVPPPGAILFITYAKVMRRSASIITDEPPAPPQEHTRPSVGEATTDAPPDRDAYHEVDPVELHLEDTVDRLGREQPDASDLAAAGHRRLDARQRAGIAVAVARADVGAPPAFCPGRFRAHGRVGPSSECHAVEVERRRVGRGRLRHHVGDAMELRERQTDVKVGAERPRNVRGKKLAQALAGDAPDHFADQVAVGQHVVARGRAWFPPRRLRRQAGRSTCPSRTGRRE